jgi:hypothetical protein
MARFTPKHKENKKKVLNFNWKKIAWKYREYKKAKQQEGSRPGGAYDSDEWSGRVRMVGPLATSADRRSRCGISSLECFCPSLSLSLWPPPLSLTLSLLFVFSLFFFVFVFLPLTSCYAAEVEWKEGEVSLFLFLYFLSLFKQGAWKLKNHRTTGETFLLFTLKLLELF